MTKTDFSVKCLGLMDELTEVRWETLKTKELGRESVRFL